MHKLRSLFYYIKSLLTRFFFFIDEKKANVKLVYENKLEPIRDKISVINERINDTISDFFAFTLPNKVEDLSWYFDILERIFDVIGNFCHYWIELPYKKFVLHIETVVLPPIFEKYKKWRFKKKIKFSFFRKKQKILFYRYIKLNYPVLINLSLIFDKYFSIIVFYVFTTIFNSTLVYYNTLFLKFIRFCSKKIYDSAEAEIEEIIKDPDVAQIIQFTLFEHGWAWYPAGLSLYELAFLIYVIWLRYQFFYDTTFANLEFYQQRMEFVLNSRRALFENNEMWATAYATASISTDSYYNAYYDKENKFRATHLFYDKFLLGPLHAYKINNHFTQGSSVLHWGSILYWQRQASLKTFNLAACFLERSLPDYYLKNFKNLFNSQHYYRYTFNTRKIYKRNSDKFPESDIDVSGIYYPRKYTHFAVRPHVERLAARYRWRSYANFAFKTAFHWDFFFGELRTWDFRQGTKEGWARTWWTPANIQYIRMPLFHFGNQDNYSSFFARKKNLFWNLNLNKELPLLVYNRNNFYNLFQNAYASCALKNFFVFEQVYSYILNSLNEMTFNEAIMRRYNSQAFLQDWFIFSHRHGFNALKRFRAVQKNCIWENYMYFNAPFRWRALSAYRSRFWEIRAHIGTFLWPAYNGETDTSYWGVRGYLYSSAYNYRPYYYYFNLIFYFYKEIFGHLWFLLLPMYWGFISSIAQMIHEFKEERYYAIYKLTEIKELDYLIRADMWIKSYNIVYFFMFIILNFYFATDYYSCLNTFTSVYGSLMDIIKEFQDINDLYCDFNDYAYGEDFLFLAMGPEFYNYADVSKRFFKDPYIVEELDLYENSFKRRDLGFEYEHFMSDNYFFLRLYSSNDYCDSLFYKKWWVRSFKSDLNWLSNIQNEKWPFIFVPHYYDYKSKNFQSIKTIIKKIKKYAYSGEKPYRTYFDRNLSWEKFFTVAYLKFFFNIDKMYDRGGEHVQAVFYKLEKIFYDYYLLHKPDFTTRYKSFSKISSPGFINRFNWLKKHCMNQTVVLRHRLVLANFHFIEEIKYFFSKLIFFHKYEKKNSPYTIFFEALLESLDESAELRKFNIRTHALLMFSSKYSPSEEAFYNQYLVKKWIFTHKRKKWPFLKNSDDDFTKATKWCNVINPFSSTTPSFFPHLYFEEDWYQSLLRRTIKKKYDHLRQSWYYYRRWKRVANSISKKIIRFQSFFNFPYIMAQRLSKSHLYLEVISQLDRIDIENLQNIKLNHESSRTIFSKHFFRKLNKHYKIYFNAHWIYGAWDARSIKLDNAINNFCHYYVRAGRYQNLNRMCLYTSGVKKIREIQWENREIPAPPNHLVEDAIWYRFVPAFYKKGLGSRKINTNWFVAHNIAQEGGIDQSTNKFGMLTNGPFLLFLKHTQNFLFYTFNPRRDIVESFNTFNLGRVPNLLPFFNLDLEYTAYAGYYLGYDNFEPDIDRKIDLSKTDVERDDSLNARRYANNFLGHFTENFDFFKNKTLAEYSPLQSLDFNLFQFVFSCYFGQFVECILSDYYQHKNEFLDEFESLNLIPKQTIFNLESRLNFYYSSDQLGHRDTYPVQYFGFFGLNPRVDSDDGEYYLDSYSTGLNLDSMKFNKFFKIEEISPSWSKLKLTLEDIKNFHEDHKQLSWLSLLTLIENNGAYWFYFLYKSTFIIFSFINILFYFNKIMIKSIRSFKFEKKTKIYYKIGEFLDKQGILNAIGKSIYTYWTYWFVFFIFFQLFFWLNEFYTFIIWMIHAIPSVIEFIFY